MRNWLRPGEFMAFLETDLPSLADAVLPVAPYADCIRWIHDAAEKAGLASAADVQVETLAERLRAAVVAGGGAIALPSLTAAGAYMED